MPEPEDDERVSKRVVYERTASSGSSRSVAWTIGAIVLIAVAIVVYILMHMH